MSYTIVFADNTLVSDGVGGVPLGVQETLTATDTVAKAPSIVHGDTVAATDAMVPTYLLKVSDGLAATDAYVNEPKPVFSNSVTTADSITTRSQTTTWNPADVDVDVTLSNSNTTAANTGAGSVRSTNGKTSGKVVFGCTVDAVGVNTYFGAIANNEVITAGLNSLVNGIAWRNDGTLISNAVTDGNIAAYHVGDTLVVAIDIPNKLMWGKVNAGNWNNSALANPATGAGGVSFTRNAHPLCIAAGFDGATGSQITINGYPATAPTGFTPWDQ